MSEGGVAIVTGTRVPHAGLRLILEPFLLEQRLWEGKSWVKIDRVLVGDADGVDAVTRHICQENQITLELFVADWDRRGAGAGPARNEVMVARGVALRAAGHPVVGFAVPDRRSRGTWHCVRVMAREGFHVHVRPVPEGPR